MINKYLKSFFIFVLTIYTSQILTENHKCSPLIGDPAPNFIADSSKGIINFPSDFKGKWKILLSHPADFTPVCESEFKRLAKLQGTFKNLNCQLVGISVDSATTHKEWVESLSKKSEKESSSKIDFPIIGDPDRKIAKKYGLIHPNASKNQTIRSVYFIGSDNKVKAILHYPSSNGRNFDEIIRLLRALQITDKEKAATPADWQPGDKTISIKDIEKTTVKKSCPL